MKERIGYTREELMSASGLAAGTIYNFTSYGIIPKPVRGADPELYSSQGLYPLTAIDRIRQYKALKLEGKTLAEIIRVMTTETIDGSEECTDTLSLKEKLPGSL